MKFSSGDIAILILTINFIIFLAYKTYHDTKLEREEEKRLKKLRNLLLSERELFLKEKAKLSPGDADS